MKHFTLAAGLALLACTLLPQPSLAAEPLNPSALAAAESFLQLLDNEDFQVAWNQTSSVNHSYSNYPAWFNKILAIRPYLGHTIKRSVAKTSHHTSWVGLPGGEYIRISFATAFLNKSHSLETVLLCREGSYWSVSSYHLR